MPFAPRGSRGKRSRTLPQVRVDDEENAIVENLVAFLSERDGASYSVSDVVRLGLAKLAEELPAPKKARR